MQACTGGSWSRSCREAQVRSAPAHRRRPGGAERHRTSQGQRRVAAWRTGATCGPIRIPAGSPRSRTSTGRGSSTSSPRGEAAERALAVFDEELGRRGALQAVALEDIATRLRALLELAPQDEPDRQGGLAAAARLSAVSPISPRTRRRSWDRCSARSTCTKSTREAFRAYKDRLIEYLERFIKDLWAPAARSPTLIDRLEPPASTGCWRWPQRREAEDAAPGTRRRTRTRAQASQPSWPPGSERGSAYNSGSSPRPSARARRSCSGRRARKAIPELLRGRGNAQRTARRPLGPHRRTSASWRVWFAQAPDEPAMHRLWQATFGLHSSRAPDARRRDTARARSRTRSRPPPPGPTPRRC